MSPCPCLSRTRTVLTRTSWPVCPRAGSRLPSLRRTSRVQWSCWSNWRHYRHPSWPLTMSSRLPTDVSTLSSMVITSLYFSICPIWVGDIALRQGASRCPCPFLFQWPLYICRLSIIAGPVSPHFFTSLLASCFGRRSASNPSLFNTATDSSASFVCLSINPRLVKSLASWGLHNFFFGISNSNQSSQCHFHHEIWSFEIISVYLSTIWFNILKVLKIKQSQLVTINIYTHSTLNEAIHLVNHQFIELRRHAVILI